MEFEYGMLVWVGIYAGLMFLASRSRRYMKRTTGLYSRPAANMIELPSDEAADFDSDWNQHHDASQDQGHEVNKIDVSDPRKQRISYNQIMIAIVSLSVLFSALFIILSGSYSEPEQKWAFGVVGTVIGFWMNNGD